MNCQQLYLLFLWKYQGLQTCRIIERYTTGGAGLIKLFDSIKGYW